MKWILVLLLLVAACATLPGDCKGQPDQEICIANEALKQEDPTVCKSIENEGLYALCISQVAAATKNMDTCALISDQRSIGFCQRDVVLATGDSDACQTISHIPARNNCYDEFARSELDWHLCRGMASGPLKVSCLSDIAKELNDPAGCLEIRGDEQVRRNCIWRTSIFSENHNTCLEIADMDTRIFCVANIAYRTSELTRCEVLDPLEQSLCRGAYRDIVRREGATFINDSSVSD